MGMKKRNYLGRHDITGGASPNIRHTPITTGNEEIDETISAFSNEVSTEHDPRYLQSFIAVGVKMAQAPVPHHDFAIMARTAYEMYNADLVFAPYRHIRKISVFGSARIKFGEPAYQTTLEFSREAVEHGYMVITGGGPGLMQAANEGAGAERSFGLNIKLPYEQESNRIIKDNPKLINFHYFFVRKLNFVAQSDAMVALPGGFGTMDEVFETLTLIQTGKASIYPIVLLDSPGKTFWLNWMAFIERELVDSNLISEDDLLLIHVTKSPQEAVEHIDRFYRIFHSYRYVRKQIVLRLYERLSDEWLEQLREEFADIIVSGELVQRDALPEESGEPLIMNLPRLVFEFPRTNYGRLRLMIDRINEYPLPGEANS